MTDRELERFFNYVIPEPNTGCWLWIGGQIKGYGQFWLGEQERAHRVIYRHAKGSIPSGHELDHRCRTITCVNPDHLEAVVHRENLRRGNGWGGRHMRATHCPQGHPYDEKNTRIGPRGRKCRTCHRDWERARRSVNLHG